MEGATGDKNREFLISHANEVKYLHVKRIYKYVVIPFLWSLIWINFVFRVWCRMKQYINILIGTTCDIYILGT